MTEIPAIFRVFAITDLHLLPLEFVSLSLGLKNSPTKRMLSFFLLREQQIFCLLTGDEQRLTDTVRFFQLFVRQQFQFFAVLEPTVVGARVAGDPKRIYLISDARAVLVQRQLLAVDIFCLAFVFDVDLQLESNFDQLVELVPRYETRKMNDMVE